jgi:hypothetical protein
MGRPTLDVKGTTIIAKDQTKEITISDKTAVDELHALIKKRKEAGIELSRKLKDHGLITASDDEVTVENWNITNIA